MMNNIKDGTLIFMHLQKTGGLTFRKILKNQYNKADIFEIERTRFRESCKEFINLPLIERGKYKVIDGHLFFGLHRFIPHPCSYITMLRDPIHRVISLYYYQLRPEHKYNISPEISLVEYLNEGIALSSDNGMTRFITGKDREDVAYGKCSHEMLEEAKENLNRHFLAIGLTERFDESIILFKRLLGWEKMPFYRRLNVNKQKPKQRQLTDSELSCIKKYNGLDIELYNYAKRLFEEQIFQQDSCFHQELKSFIQQNKEIEE